MNEPVIERPRMFDPLILPLWYRAMASLEEEPLLKDEKAISFLKHLNIPLRKPPHSLPSQLVYAIRAQILDKWVHQLDTRYPGSLFVNLESGLCTRYDRILPEKLQAWIDIDLPDVEDQWTKLHQPDERRSFRPASLIDGDWIKHTYRYPRSSLFVIAEDMLTFYTEEEVIGFFQVLREKLPRAEVIFDYAGPRPSLSFDPNAVCTGTSRPVKWSLRSVRYLNTLIGPIEVVGDWNILDLRSRQFRRMAGLNPGFFKTHQVRLAWIRFI